MAQNLPQFFWQMPLYAGQDVALFALLRLQSLESKRLGRESHCYTVKIMVKSNLFVQARG